MVPSLYSLFRRSKYSNEPAGGDDDDDARERSQRQVERFAVAAIGFCLTQDPAFRSHFLQRICNERVNSAGSNFEILIEDEAWGDLTLLSEDRSLAFVIEGKINAPLQPHQNPDSREEFWQLGYGKDLKEHFRSFRTRVTYIVLGYPEQLRRLKDTNGIALRQKFWEDLATDFPRTPLSHDLYRCLAALGVAAFRSSQTNNMKQASHAKSASQTHRLLKDLLKELKLVGVRHYDDISYEPDEDWWYFGIGITKKKVPVFWGSGCISQQLYPFVKGFGQSRFARPAPANLLARVCCAAHR